MLKKSFLVVLPIVLVAFISSNITLAEEQPVTIQIKKTKKKKVVPTTETEVLQKENKKIKVNVSNEPNRPLVELNSNDTSNYLCNGDQSTIFLDESGSYFRRWEKNELPIKIYISEPDSIFNVKEPREYVDTVKKAFLRWGEKVPNLKFNFVESKSNANITLKWIEFFTPESGHGNAWGLAQLPEYSTKLKKRMSEITFAVKTQPGSGISGTSVFFSQEELLQIATHEVAHSLGLVHSFEIRNNPDIMSTSYRAGYPLYTVDISDRDVASMKKLYSFPENAKVICK